MGQSPHCYISSFIKIGQPVPEKKILYDLPYMGMAAILVMSPGPFLYKLSFPIPKDAPHEVWL